MLTLKVAIVLMQYHIYTYNIPNVADRWDSSLFCTDVDDFETRCKVSVLPRNFSLAACLSCMLRCGNAAAISVATG